MRFIVLLSVLAVVKGENFVTLKIIFLLVALAVIAAQLLPISEDLGSSLWQLLLNNLFVEQMK